MALCALNDFGKQPEGPRFGKVTSWHCKYFKSGQTFSLHSWALQVFSNFHEHLNLLLAEIVSVAVKGAVNCLWWSEPFGIAQLTWLRLRSEQPWKVLFCDQVSKTVGSSFAMSKRSSAAKTSVQFVSAGYHFTLVNSKHEATSWLSFRYGQIAWFCAFVRQTTLGSCIFYSGWCQVLQDHVCSSVSGGAECC